jgi:predicted HicB family RNase H-like nuclease
MAGSPLLLRPPDELLARLTDDAEAKGVSVQQLIIELVMAQ